MQFTAQGWDGAEGYPSGRFPGIVEQKEFFGSQNLKDKKNFNNHLENYN